MRATFEKDFEEGMVEFRSRRDVDSTAFLRDIAAYFVQFEPGPRNLYHDFVATIRACNQLTTIATTNYDVLIEQAATQAGLAVSYKVHPIPPNNLSVLKLHGSCHFLPDLGTNIMRGVSFSGNATNVEAPVRIAVSTAEVLAFCNSEDSLAPAIALYAPGKRVLFSSGFVLRQQELWREAVSDADVIYTVGLRVLPADEHIWGAIGSAKGAIEYVGFEPDHFLSWADAKGRRNVHVLAKSFEAALPHIHGRIVTS